MRLTYKLQARVISGWSDARTPAGLNINRERVSDPVLRPATSADTREILDLVATSYERQDGPSRLEYWRWKHDDNPFGVSPCLVAESHGRIVGVRVFLRWIWCSGSRHVRAVRAVDTATLPEWRGRGVFSRLTMRLVEQMQQEGVSFIYNTPNHKSMPGYLKMGWASVKRLPLWVRPVRLSTLMHRTFDNGSIEAPRIGGFRSVMQVLDDPRLPAFLSDITLDDERYHTARTAGYLRWRYAQIPGVSYKARLDIVGDAGALVIARCRVRGRLREVTISELLVTPSLRGRQIACAMLTDLLRHTDADYVAACAARDTGERQALARTGFLPVPRLGPHFTARCLDSTAPDPAQWANWRCSIGDLELF